MMLESHGSGHLWGLYWRNKLFLFLRLHTAGEPV